ncbi:MAG: hypothetical protein HY597_03855 [Candidatus Omnitrophica bacterium]|nr:hypothetical protein [Candidatus Omnitrophota bacterium]
MWPHRLRLGFTLLLTSTLIAARWTQDPSTRPAPTPADTAATITQQCRERCHIAPVVRRAGRTLHIYLPLEEDMVSLDQWGAFWQTLLGQPHRTVYYAGETTGQYDTVAGRFHFVSQAVNQPGQRENPPIKMARVISCALGTVHRALLATREPIDFFSLTATDIRNGDEYVYICYLPDLRLAMKQVISESEFAKRVIRQAAKHPDAIGDRTGAHVSWEEIYFPQFLAVQIGERVAIELNDWRRGNIKDAEIAPFIVWIASTVLEAYRFREYQTVSIQHVPTQQDALFYRASLEPRARQHLDWEAWWRTLPPRLRSEFHAAPVNPEPAFHQLPQRPGI